MKYLKKSAKAIVLIVILLFLQAYCDLSLPSYTSEIVDVGIQQGGIENAVATQLRSETMKQLAMFFTPEEKSIVEQSYEKTGDMWVLKEIDDAVKEKLDAIFAKPMNAMLF